MLLPNYEEVAHANVKSQRGHVLIMQKNRFESFHQNSLAGGKNRLLAVEENPCDEGPMVSN